ncbi:MAG: protein kinase [Anaerolineae bacterium]|nr:protein kinase [Anaerolineae bacterium]
MSQPATGAALLGNRYQIVEEIGAGGMGVVYRALDRLTGEAVALKRVHVAHAHLMYASRGSTDDLRLSLAQEFRTLASLRHPNIISVLDYGFDDDRQPYYAMELLQQPRDLLVYGHDLSISAKVGLLVQMLQALAYLHRRGIVHRDLKPDNAMVVNGEVKVLDFGLAVAWEYQRDRASDGVEGTLAYMAPEVLSGGQATVSADLYAIGVIAYELFGGRYPFAVHDVNQLVNDILYTPPDVEPLNLDPLLNLVLVRLLAKTPDMRYESADETIVALCEAVGQPPPPESVAIRESFLQAAQFVGREPEMQPLRAALEESIQGKGSAWLVGGESGVGKSRLMEELRVFAMVDGVTVLRSQGSARGGLPYEFWREPVRRLALAVELSDTDAAILKEIVPDIETLLQRDIPDLPELEGQTGRQRLIGAIVNLFRRQTRPIALLVDDLQWAVESLEVLKVLVNGVNDSAMLIVGSYRDDEAPALPRQMPTMQHIKLERLPAPAIEQLSISMLGAVGQQRHVVDLLERETEGNVFFLIEVVRALAEEAGRLADIGMATLPQRVFAGGIQQIVLRRLNKVPTFARPLLKLAAVAGRRLDLKVLATIMSDQPPTSESESETDSSVLSTQYSVLSLEDWLVICADAAVLETLEGDWRFTHDKLREGLLDGMQPDELTELHRLVALGLEAVYPNAPEQWVSLAYHWRNAGNASKERHYAALAGQQQLKNGAYRDAMHSLQRTIWLTLPDENERRTFLILRLGEAHQGVSDYAEARRLFEDARRLAEEMNNPGLLADALQHLGMLANIQGDFEGAKSLFSQCLTAAEAADDRAMRVFTLGHMGEIATNQGAIETATRLLNEGVALARATGDLRATVFILRIESKLHYQTKDYDGARRIALESLMLAEKIGDRYHVARNNNALGVLAATLGDYPEAQNRYSTALTLFREIGDRWGAAFVQNNLAFVELFMQELRSSVGHFYGALELSLAIGAIPVILEVFVGLARVLIEIGRDDEALELFGLALHHPATFTDVRTLAEPGLERLKAELPAAAIESGLARGQAQTGAVNEIAARLLTDRDSVIARLGS